MADERLRGLERLAARGDPGARARVLQERVRLGELAHERLRLAAYVGDAAARLALGAAAPEPPEAAREWVLGLEPWGAEPCVRAAAAVGAAVLPAWEAVREDRRPRRALEAVERWLAAPGPAAALECRLHAEELWADPPWGRAVGPWYVIAAAAWTPAPWSARGAFGAARLVAEGAARCAGLARGEDLPYYLAPGSVRPCLDEEALREVLRAALRAWLLGPPRVAAPA